MVLVDDLQMYKTRKDILRPSIVLLDDAPLQQANKKAEKNEAKVNQDASDDPGDVAALDVSAGQETSEQSMEVVG
jgi:hypothetical protein